MNETERAIETLEERFMTMSMCGDVEYCKAQNRALDIAIAALREKAEREKGCEYCNPNPYGHGEAIKKLIAQTFNDKAHIHTLVRGNGLHTIAYPSPQDTNLAKTYSKCKIINYCPMCGKRLEVEHE